MSECDKHSIRDNVGSGLCALCLADALEAYGLLQPPSEQGKEVFAKVLENKPDADMRAIPNEWLLTERRHSQLLSDALEAKGAEIVELHEVIKNLRHELLHEKLKSQDRGTTHSEECWSFGRRHYECALNKIISSYAIISGLQHDLSTEIQAREYWRRQCVVLSKEL